MPDPCSIPSTGPRISEERDNALERLELLAGDDDAIASFLDEIDVRSPRERELLTELARLGPIVRPERLGADPRHAVVALESLRRHGFHGSRAASRLGPIKAVVRWVIELVARFIVVSYVKSVASNMRNLYWLREIESPDLGVDRLLRQAAEGQLPQVRDRRDHVDRRRLDHPADDRRHRARTLIPSVAS